MQQTRGCCLTGKGHTKGVWPKRITEFRPRKWNLAYAKNEGVQKFPLRAKSNLDEGREMKKNFLLSVPFLLLYTKARNWFSLRRQTQKTKQRRLRFFAHLLFLRAPLMCFPRERDERRRKGRERGIDINRGRKEEREREWGMLLLHIVVCGAFMSPFPAIFSPPFSS